MKTFAYTIKDELGIHARPAGALAKEAIKYESAIQIVKGEKAVIVTHLLKLMALGIKKGDTVSIVIEGTDEEVAITGMQTFFENNL